jgi:hypothetical protein
MPARTRVSPPFFSAALRTRSRVLSPGSSAPVGSRVIRVTWEKIRDSVTLSDDLSRIQGINQYGVAVSGVRLPGGC